MYSPNSRLQRVLQSLKTSHSPTYYAALPVYNLARHSMHEPDSSLTVNIIHEGDNAAGISCRRKSDVTDAKCAVLSSRSTNLCATDCKTAKKLLSLLDFSREHLLCAISSSIWPAVREIAEENKCSCMFDEPFDMYILMKDQYKECAVPTGYNVGTLLPKDIAMVDREWKYGGSDWTKIFISHIISSGKTACVLDSTDKVVSYCVCSPDGQIGMGYTKPAFRGKGLAKVALNKLGKMLFDEKEPIVFTFTSQNNPSAVKSLKDSGFTAVPEMQWSWIVLKPRAVKSKM